MAASQDWTSLAPSSCHHCYHGRVRACLHQFEFFGRVKWMLLLAVTLGCWLRIRARRGLNACSFLSTSLGGGYGGFLVPVFALGPSPALRSRKGDGYENPEIDRRYTNRERDWWEGQHRSHEIENVLYKPEKHVDGQCRNKKYRSEDNGSQPRER